MPPDGRWTLKGTQIWDTLSGKLDSVELPAHPASILANRFSPTAVVY